MLERLVLMLLELQYSYATLSCRPPIIRIKEHLYEIKNLHLLQVDDVFISLN